MIETNQKKESDEDGSSFGIKLLKRISVHNLRK